MADTEVVDWAADVEAEEREKNRLAGNVQATEVVKEVRPQLPEIPKIFDPDTYEEPEPVIVKKGNNMYTKYSVFE